MSRHPPSQNLSDSGSTQWDESFSHLKQFAEREGHSRVSQSYRTDDGYRLGQWVSVQRTNREKMNLHRRQRLETTPGWSWDPFSDRWDEGFAYLAQFAERVGHCRVSQRYRTDDGYWLGRWVSVQRTNKEKINPDRRQRLETLPGWSWDRLSEQWDDGFSHLKQFAEREGHCRVPNNHRSDDGYRLGQWVTVQRRKKSRMGSDRRQRLEALPGWIWRMNK
jgi:Helicase associated domain